MPIASPTTAQAIWHAVAEQAPARLQSQNQQNNSTNIPGRRNGALRQIPQLVLVDSPSAAHRESDICCRNSSKVDIWKGYQKVLENIEQDNPGPTGGGEE